MAQGTITNPKFALAYMFAGRATITFRSAKTGDRFTYKIRPSNVDDFKAGKPVRWFVKFLFGPDNSNDFKYLGQVFDNKFTLTKKSRELGLSETTPAYIAFKAAFDSLKVAIKMPSMLEVFHSGKCARCSRKLTVPESVENGFGPECIEFAQNFSPCPVVLPTPRPQSGTSQFASQPKMSGYAAARAVYAPVKPKVHTTADGGSFLDSQRKSAVATGDLDKCVREKINEYKADAPENYYQDGMLTEEEAFKVAYNKFRYELQTKDRKKQ